MITESLFTVLRGLLLCLSFIGLCAFSRSTLKINRFCAPFFSACTVIMVLMLCGMLRILPYGFGALYIGGFAGLIYAYFIRRTRPDWALIAAFAAFSAYLIWRFWPCTLFRNDDVSHWGLVARYLLENDAFPDRTTSIVFFQSYPLGSASFIYYICRAVSNCEGLWLAAQNLLLGIFFLPVFAHIRGNRRWLVPITALLFVYLFKYNRVLVNLQVDWLLGFFGIGVGAAILSHKDDLRRALLIAIPAVCAVVYIKNSGMFFAMEAVIITACIARSHKLPRRKIAAIAVLGTLLFVGAYLLWTLHIRLSFSAALESKHAISLDAYAHQAAEKGGAFILDIAWKMLLSLIPRQFYQLFACAFMAAAFACVPLVCRFVPELRPVQKKLLLKLVACTAVYVVWYVMLYAMYVFSMPAAEATVLASFYRYNATGLLCMIGLTTITMLDFLSHPALKPGRAVKITGAAAVACCLAAAPFLDLANSNIYVQLLTRDTDLLPIRERLIAAREEYNLPKGGKYLIFAIDGAEDRPLYTTCYQIKYELYTADQLLIALMSDGAEQVYGYGVPNGNATIGDPRQFILDHINEIDAFLLIDEDPGMEALLADMPELAQCDTPIIYTYR